MKASENELGATRQPPALGGPARRDRANIRRSQLAELWATKATACERAGKLEEAAMALRRALNLRPGAGQWLMRLASLASKLRARALEASALERIDQLKGLPPTLKWRLLALQARAGRRQEVLAGIDALQVLDSASPIDLARRIDCLLQVGQQQAAEKTLDRLLVTADPTGEAISLWAQFMLDRLGRPEDVIRHLSVRSDQPEVPWTIPFWLGRALAAVRQHPEAARAFRRATQLAPDNASAWFELAVVQRHSGNRPAAQSALERAARLAPGDSRILRVHGYDHRYGTADPAFVRVKRALAELDRYADGARVELHYAAAKAFDDVGDAQTAFAHYAEAGRIQKQLSPWSDEPMRRLLEGLRAWLSGERLAELRKGGHSSDTPVFVVGMPRSGTSLVEQIIASHPQAHGAGELRLLPEALDGLKLGRVTLRTIAAGPAASDLGPVESTISERAQRYVAALEKLAPGAAARIVDKMPHNYHWLGLIDAMLPNSYIVHCRRHPLDVCLSQYKLFFGAEVPYSYDFTDLARAYRLYDDYCRLWSALLPPGRVLEIRYERLVSDPLPQILRLLEYLELPWDEACGSPERTARTVTTASSTQVRMPIGTSAIGRWKNDERFIEPLATALADLVADYERD